MTNLKLLLLLPFILFSACKKDDEAEEQYCKNAKIIRTTCGGTVLQILKPNNVGSNWTDVFTSERPSYTNCVLVENVPTDKQTTGNIISIKYEIVTQFKDGNFCDIGGLPPIKANIVKLYNNCQTINEQNN